MFKSPASFVSKLIKTSCTRPCQRDIMTQTFFDAVKARRSIYHIKPEVQVSKEKIKEVIDQAVLHSPSSFNVQSARVVVLYGAEKDKFWDYLTGVLKTIVAGNSFDATQQKMDSFKASHGTVLFFEDEKDVHELQEKFVMYKEHMPTWSEQGNGMLQYIIWTGLESLGLGASLQHYNQLVAPWVLETFKLPTTWQLKAQMPFGAVGSPAGEKQFKPLEDRVKVFGQ